MKTLRELYAEHDGKVSDKWSLYFDEYERLLAPYRSRPVRILEIGVQNGGVLELWSRYFAEAKRIVGCDVNPDCGKLAYDDPRIALVVGDANLDETQQRIVSICDTFDVIIDDGSHRSSDIVRSFARWFPRLADGGLYIVEDLHCSYWKAFEGGLHDELSSIAFLKTLGDVISHEHWGLPRTRVDELRPFAERYGVAFDEHMLEHVHSVELVNSMAFLRKAAPAKNALGTRVVAGREASVGRAPLDARDGRLVAPAQADPGSTLERLEATTLELESTRRTLARREAELRAVIEALQRELALVTASTSWRITRPLRTASKLLFGFWPEQG